MRGGVAPPRGFRLPPAKGRVLTPNSREFGLAPACYIAGASSSGPWVSANDPIAVPFTLDEAATVYKIGWLNGSAAGDNVDHGIYDEAWVRLVSTGSTTGVGNSTLQTVDVTDTLLPAGRYYVAVARDTTTANRHQFIAHGASAVVMNLLGVQDSATDAFPLPNPLTNMAGAATMTRVPAFWLWMRA